MTTTYTCDKFRPIQLGYERITYDRHGYPSDVITVEGPGDAAMVFANRIARKEFGRRGFCHHVRQDCWREDGAYIVYEAFVGRPWDGYRGCSGHNVWLTVYIHRDDAEVES